MKDEGEIEGEVGLGGGGGWRGREAGEGGGDVKREL